MRELRQRQRTQHIEEVVGGGVSGAHNRRLQGTPSHRQHPATGTPSHRHTHTPAK
jgi:hypothetical protein